MNSKLLMPQEIEVFYIIPTIRKYLSLYMKENGLSQKEIAKTLNIQESTVSQYVTEKRASQIEFNSFIKKEIKEATLRVKNQQDFIRETQRLLFIIRTQNVLCELHKQLSPEISKTCSISKMGCS